MRSNIFIIISSLIFFTYLNASSKEAKYECKPTEILDVNTGATVKKFTDSNIGITLTVSNEKIFDGTYFYTFSNKIEDEYGGRRVYTHKESGRSITFPKTPIQKSRELNIYNVMYGDPKTTVGMFFYCSNAEELKAFRAKLTK